MEIRAIIKKIMKDKGLRNKVVAERLGLTDQAFWDRLSNTKRKTMGIEASVEMLRAMDYKLVVMPRNARMPEGAMEVGADE